LLVKIYKTLTFPETNYMHLRLMDKWSIIEDVYKLHGFSYTIIIKIIFSYILGVTSRK